MGGGRATKSLKIWGGKEKHLFLHYLYYAFYAQSSITIVEFSLHPKQLVSHSWVENAFWIQRGGGGGG